VGAAREEGDGGADDAEGIEGPGLEEEESLARFLKACAYIRFGGIALQVRSIFIFIFIHFEGVCLHSPLGWCRLAGAGECVWRESARAR
jgi:hypothetical protein